MTFTQLADGLWTAHNFQFVAKSNWNRLSYRLTHHITYVRWKALTWIKFRIKIEFTAVYDFSEIEYPFQTKMRVSAKLLDRFFEALVTRGKNPAAVESMTR